MNILFVFPVASGGMTTLNHERNLALAKKGIKCHFLYLKTYMNPAAPCDSHVFIMKSDTDIKELLRKHKYKAIIVCTDYLFLEKLRGLGYEGPIIYEIQGVGDYQATVKWLKKAETIAAVHADAILTPNTPFLNQLIKKHFPKTKKFTFHNCINTDLFTFTEVAKPKKLIIGWVGRLDTNKNWIEFLKIGASLRDKFPHIQLWFFHDPAVISKKEQLNFMKWVKKFQLSQDLIIYENIQRNHMPKYYSMIAKSGGFVCSTSKLEGFGYAVIEAMSCKCPVLTTKSGGVESFVRHNVTGKLYHQGNIEEALGEANELINNLKLRKKLILHAHQLIKASFSPLHYAEHFFEMLQDLKLV